MFGFTALTAGQLSQLSDYVAQTTDDGTEVVGLIVSNPGPRQVEVSLIGSDGQPFGEKLIDVQTDDLLTSLAAIGGSEAPIVL